MYWIESSIFLCIGKKCFIVCILDSLWYRNSVIVLDVKESKETPQSLDGVSNKAPWCWRQYLQFGGVFASAEASELLGRLEGWRYFLRYDILQIIFFKVLSLPVLLIPTDALDPNIFKMHQNFQPLILHPVEEIPLPSFLSFTCDTRRIQYLHWVSAWSSCLAKSLRQGNA